MEHERRAHVDVQTPSVVRLPVFERRFRSALEPGPTAADYKGRKRLYVGNVDGSPLTADHHRRYRPRQWPKDTSVRTVLKARRSSLFSSVRLPHRPVAESSPAVSSSSPPPPLVSLSPQRDAEIGTPVGQLLSEEQAGVTPTSVYETPMQTPCVSVSPYERSGSVASSAAAEDDTPAAIEDDTPAAIEYDTPAAIKDDTSAATEKNTPPAGADDVAAAADTMAKRRVSLTQKGFFWSNVARRFRLALRPAKSRVRDSSTSPPVTNADVAKYYDNIQPRRPIKDDILTPVNARPALEVFRQAHEQATRRAVSNDKSGD